MVSIWPARLAKFMCPISGRAPYPLPRLARSGAPSAVLRRRIRQQRDPRPRGQIAQLCRKIKAGAAGTRATAWFMANATSAALGRLHVTFGQCLANLCLPGALFARSFAMTVEPNAAVRAALCGALALAAWASPALAEPTHAIAMHGKPAMADGFIALPYADPDAPKGGRLVEGVLGTFDSLNPMIVQGLAVQPIRGYVVESLMARSYDEPFTLYGLLARTIDTD